MGDLELVEERQPTPRALQLAVDQTCSEWPDIPSEHDEGVVIGRRSGRYHVTSR